MRNLPGTTIALALLAATSAAAESTVISRRRRAVTSPSSRVRAPHGTPILQARSSSSRPARDGCRRKVARSVRLSLATWSGRRPVSSTGTEPPQRPEWATLPSRTWSTARTSIGSSTSPTSSTGDPGKPGLPTGIEGRQPGSTRLMSPPHKYKRRSVSNLITSFGLSSKTSKEMQT
jgi:hypothetical protein